MSREDHATRGFVIVSQKNAKYVAKKVDGIKIGVRIKDTSREARNSIKNRTRGIITLTEASPKSEKQLHGTIIEVDPNMNSEFDEKSGGYGPDYEDDCD